MARCAVSCYPGYCSNFWKVPSCQHSFFVFFGKYLLLESRLPFCSHALSYQNTTPHRPGWSSWIHVSAAILLSWLWIQKMSPEVTQLLNFFLLVLMRAWSTSTWYFSWSWAKLVHVISITTWFIWPIRFLKLSLNIRSVTSLLFCFVVL